MYKYVNMYMYIDIYVYVNIWLNGFMEHEALCTWICQTQMFQFL